MGLFSLKRRKEGLKEAQILEGTKRMELGAIHWCPVTEQEAMSPN